MKNTNNVIYLTEEGHKEYLKETQSILDEIQRTEKEKSELQKNAEYREGVDDTAISDINLRLIMLYQRLSDRINKRVELIQKLDEANVVDIDDFVKVKVLYSESDVQELIFKLNGTSNINLDAEYPEATINSPLGKEVFGKQVGYHGFYKLEGKDIPIIILGFSKDASELKDKVR